MPEQIADLPFPVNGIEVSVALHDQVPGTTPVGLNVRTCEPLTYRQRGGSRPGLARQFEQIPGGPSLIQNLNTVDPTDEAATLDFDYVIGGGMGGLPAAYVGDPSVVFNFPDISGGGPAGTGGPGGTVNPPPSGWIYDPSTPGPPTSWGDDPTNLLTRNPGRLIPVGGSGVQPHKNTKPKVVPGKAVILAGINMDAQFSTYIANMTTYLTAKGITASYTGFGLPIIPEHRWPFASDPVTGQVTKDSVVNAFYTPINSYTYISNPTLMGGKVLILDILGPSAGTYFNNTDISGGTTTDYGLETNVLDGIVASMNAFAAACSSIAYWLWDATIDINPSAANDAESLAGSSIRAAHFSHFGGTASFPDGLSPPDNANTIEALWESITRAFFGP